MTATTTLIYPDGHNETHWKKEANQIVSEGKARAMTTEEQMACFKKMQAKAVVKEHEDINQIFEARLSEMEQPAYTEELSKIKPLSQILSEGIPKIEWRVDNLVLKKGITIFGGSAGSYKTFAGMDLAVAIATGSCFLDCFPTVQGIVCYIDEENGDVTIFSRFDSLVRGRKLSTVPDNLYVSIYNNIVLDYPNGAELLEAIIARFAPDVIILDSLVRMMVGDEDKSKDMRQIFTNLKSFSDKDIAFVILHHTIKSNFKGMRGLRGSGDLSAFADVVLMFNGGKEGFCYVDIVKNRHQQIDANSSFYFQVVTNPDGSLSLIYKGTSDNLGDVSERFAGIIETWIETDKIDSFETKTIKDLAQKNGFSDNAAFGALNYLLEQHRLIKLKRGRYKVDFQSLLMTEEEII